MATYVKYHDFVLQLASGTHNLTAAGNVVKVVIHSDAPTVATDDELADLSQVTGTGYTAGGIDILNDISNSSGTLSLTSGLSSSDAVWTASAADWTAGRYISLHNDTSTTDKLICNWDYGANFTVGNGESFTVDFGANIFTLA